MVLLENDESVLPGMIGGHTDHFLQVFVEKGNLKANDLIEFELVNNVPEGLIGKRIS